MSFQPWTEKLFEMVPFQRVSAEMGFQQIRISLGRFADGFRSMLAGCLFDILGLGHFQVVTLLAGST
jgi:hypothetical protein